jgi:hypothetical protein
MASSLQENFIMHLSLKKVKFPSAQREQIHQALLDFHKEKYPRTNALTQKATVVGVSMVVSISIKFFLRDWFFMPMFIHT